MLDHSPCKALRRKQTRRILSRREVIYRIPSPYPHASPASPEEVPDKELPDEELDPELQEQLDIIKELNRKDEGKVFEKIFMGSPDSWSTAEIPTPQSDEDVAPVDLNWKSSGESSLSSTEA